MRLCWHGLASPWMGEIMSHFSCFSILNPGILILQNHNSSIIVLLGYPASSWFLLRRTREKPLQTVCFSFEHARIRHAARDAFDVRSICLYTGPKTPTKDAPDLRRSVRFIIKSVVLSL